MFTTPEQFSAATKSTMESQIAMMTSLAQKTFAGVEKLIELNMTVAKTTLEESNAAMRQMLSAKDAQEFFAMTTAQTQPNTEKVISYSRHVAGIASEVQAEFTKAAEATIAETNRKVVELVDEAAKNAPAGSENAIAMFKSALGTANAGYEQISRTTKQAVATMEGNVNNAVTQISDAAVKTAARVAKK
ncbi:MAG: TIGR01841 family phasin [Pseudomonadota bacterium]|nr:TIGR01841 family phasin [Pseudomonadota bacterium]